MKVKICDKHLLSLVEKTKTICMTHQFLDIELLSLKAGNISGNLTESQHSSTLSNYKMFSSSLHKEVRRQSPFIPHIFFKSFVSQFAFDDFLKLSSHCFAVSIGNFINNFKRLLRQHVVGGNWNIVLQPDVLTQPDVFYVVQRQKRLTTDLMPPQGKEDFLKCRSSTCCMPLHRNPSSQKCLTSPHYFIVISPKYVDP